MKYKRPTKRIAKDEEAFLFYSSLHEAIDRLAEFEDKIERGELISTVQSERGEQEIAFFLKHDAKVCKEVVKECLQVLRDTRTVRIYDDYEWGWDSGIDTAIKRLAERYNIDVEEYEE